ncbi:hypothetical protein [uncultured Vibrio sp.]|uniref:hypothetical protein n=1 Tax=uncultured Vibrio sp. TaxID=114054 RepID=UPI000912A27F|nr:hypothetical protein [uncultured Vibrio sp.]OIQ25890.1 MAG: hypothetical protein BM561_03400 [Vibrio sp. MedPE-SWchi]
MLTFISACAFITSVIFVALYKNSTSQNKAATQRKYEIIFTLRQLLALCCQHRRATHAGLTTENIHQEKLDSINEQILERSNHLIAIAHFNNKPSFRILQRNLLKLSQDWPAYTVARNQVTHGAAVRHCMYLMDEIAMNWLVESGKAEVSEQYHSNWQQIMDCMEALTQMRISIQNRETQSGKLSTKYRCDTMRRKLNQLALTCPFSVVSPTCSAAMRELEEMIDNPYYEPSNDQLYALSNDISDSIRNTYDKILLELTEDLYKPLPEIKKTLEIHA